MGGTKGCKPCKACQAARRFSARTHPPAHPHARPQSPIRPAPPAPFAPPTAFHRAAWARAPQQLQQEWPSARSPAQAAAHKHPTAAPVSAALVAVAGFCACLTPAARTSGRSRRELRHPVHAARLAVHYYVQPPLPALRSHPPRCLAGADEAVPLHSGSDGRAVVAKPHTQRGGGLRSHCLALSLLPLSPYPPRRSARNRPATGPQTVPHRPANRIGMHGLYGVPPQPPPSQEAARPLLYRALAISHDD